MPRGERVGEAYIRILADGTGLDKSIRKEMGRGHEAMHQSGETASEEYSDGFERGMHRQSKENRKALRDNLAGGRGLMDGIAETMGSNFAKELKNELRRATKGVGTGGKGDYTLADTIWNNLMGDFQRTGNKNIFSTALENLPRLVHDATRQIQQAEDRFNRDRESAYTEQEGRNRRILADLHLEALNANRLFDQKRLKEAQDADRDFEAEQARFADMLAAYRENERRDQKRHFDMLAAYRENDRRNQKSYNDMLSEAYRVNGQRNRQQVSQMKALRASLTDHLLMLERVAKGTEENDTRFKTGAGRASLLADLRNLSDEAERFGIRNAEMTDRINDNDRAIRRLAPRLMAYSNGFDKLGERVGKAFGKGSRNDFVNVIGGIAGGIVSLPGLLGKVGQGFVRYRARLQEASAAGRLGITLFKDVGTAVGGLAGLLGGTFLLIGPLVSTLSMLGGVVTALAASLGMGLAGGLGALAGTILPFAAAVGGLALAFTNLTAEQKKSLVPMKDAFKEWGKVANAGLFNRLGDQMRELGPIMTSLNPVIRRVGTQLGRQFELAFKGSKSGAFGEFRDSLERFLPDATKRLGDTLRHTLGGAGGLFRALIPITREFIGWIDEGTTKFSKWANSIKGQNSMKKFFKEAGDSAKALGGFLGSVGKLLGTITRQGSSAGDTLFGDMTKAVDGWNAALKANPDIMGKWFDDAVKFGRALGTMVVGVGKLFAALDSETSRGLATTALRTLTALLGVLNGVLQPIASLLDGVSGGFKSFAAQAGAAAFILPRLSGAFDGVKSRATGFVSGLKDSETRMARLGEAARGAAGIGGLLLLQHSMESTNDSMKILGSAAGGALTGFSVGGPWGAAIGGAAGLMGGLAYATEQSAQAFENSIKFNEDYAASFDQVTGAITRATKQAVFRNLQNDESLTVSRMIGIPDRQAVAAAMGDVAALRGITNKVKSLTGGKNAFFNKDSAADFVNGFRYMGHALTAEQKKFLEMINATRELRGALRGIPKNVKTKIEAMALNPTVKGIEKLRDRYKLTPKQVQTVVKALGMEKAWNDAHKVTDSLKEVGRQKPKPKIDAPDTKPSTHATDSVKSALKALGGYTSNPRINIDSASARAEIAAVQARINALYGKTIVVRTEHMDVRLGKPTATGGIFEGARGVGVLRTIGEAGAEAVVPLNRPLSMVDPAVRELSAFAQGKGAPRMASGGVVAGRSIDASGWTIVSPGNPEAVAAQVVNRLAASGY